jgi:hypothetical protein
LVLATLDICVPASGCAYLDISFPDIELFDAAYDALIQSLGDGIYFYEDEPGSDITAETEAAILNWISKEVVQVKTPFCYKQSYGCGWGEPLTECLPGKETEWVYFAIPRASPCTVAKALLTAGNVGLFCRLAEYGRGAGVLWKAGDGFQDSGMFSRCLGQAPYGCEKNGAIVYPKCKPGYQSVRCCICRPSPKPNCANEGYLPFPLCLLDVQW